MSENSEINYGEKISVIIPIYNTEKYLIRCMDSIISNTYKNLEIICINDGSTDGSLSILRDYEKQDKRVLIINIENGGVSRARNIGLKRASGEIISFVDSDDWVHKRYFEVLINSLVKYSADMAVCSYYRTAEYLEIPDISEETVAVQVYNRDEILNHHVIKSYIWGRLYHRRCLENVSFYEGIRVSEDKAFNTAVFAASPKLKVVFMNCALYGYYNRDDSAINNSSGIEYFGLSKLFLIEIDNNLQNKEAVRIFLHEAFVNSINSRYLTMFNPEPAVREEINKYVKSCLKYERELKPFSKSHSMRLRLLAKFPFIYRLFRISTDRTMLEWEKNEKEKYSKQI